MTMPNGQMSEVLELVLEMLVEAETLIVFQTYVKMCLRSDSTVAA